MLGQVGGATPYHSDMPTPPFHESLASMRMELLEISFVARAAWEEATTAMLERDLDAEAAIAQSVASMRKQSTAMEAQTFRLISANAPMIDDLRFVLVTQRVVQELAVIGALALEASSRVARLSSDDLDSRTTAEIAAMGRAVDEMLRSAIDSFLAIDPVAAREVISRCDEVEQQHLELTSRLFNQGGSPRTTAELVAAARVFPRVADHVAIIAERVVYLATGYLGPDQRP